MSEGLVWSVLLAAVGILGIYLAGRKNLWGWALGVGAQVLWIVFAIVTEQYGFILSALAYGWVYGLNWWKWSRERRAGSVLLEALASGGPLPEHPAERRERRREPETGHWCNESHSWNGGLAPMHWHIGPDGKRAPAPPTVGPKGSAGDSGASRT